jgi:hypothetical protein
MKENDDTEIKESVAECDMVVAELDKLIKLVNNTEVREMLEEAANGIYLIAFNKSYF